MVGWPQRTVLERVLDSESVAFPKQLIECGSIDFTKSLVAASDHLSMLPEHCVAADLREGTIKSLAITVPGLKRDIAVIFRERSPLDSVSQELITQIGALGTELSGTLKYQHG